MTRYYSYQVKTECPKCGTKAVINGPLLKAKCPSCKRFFKIGKDAWKNVIENSAGLGGDVTILTEGGFSYQYRCEPPACAHCQARLDILKITTGSEQTLLCGACGRTNTTYPAPQWLTIYRKGAYEAVQILCADKEPAGRNAPDEEKKPIAVRCISCGAVLKVDQNTPQTVTCEHCDTAQYLPDNLWLTLHPVKTVRKWFIRFER